MTHVHAEAARSTRSAAAETKECNVKEAVTK